MDAAVILTIAAGAVAVVVLARRSRTAALEAAAREADLRVALAQAEAGRATPEQVVATILAKSAEGMRGQGEQLVQLAEAKYGELQKGTDAAIAGHGTRVVEGLSRLDERLRALERERTSSAVELRTLVDELSRATADTKREAGNLAAALRDNRVRGAWGETQLRRVLELAGLARHADFVEQRGWSDADAACRPDVVVGLANDRCIVIDAKVPLDRYLEAAGATDPAVERRLQVEHAKAVAVHVKALSSRNYTGKVDGSVDFVLMFLPGDPFLAAAMDADPSLFEAAAAKNVFLVTPSSLLPMLRGVAAGWRERQAEAAAAEIHALGVELHDRIGLFAERLAKVGTQLERTVTAYNDSVGSLDSRLAPTARKLAEHGAGSSRPVPELPTIDTMPRHLRAISPTDRLDPVDAPEAVEPPGRTA